MKERLSNFELLRIIAMLMIVWGHCNYYALGAVTPTDVVSNPANSFIRIFMEQLCVIGVNVFVLISGWFGIRATFKGACSLLFQVCFYGVIILGIALAFHLPIPLVPSLKVFFFGAAYWFVPAYLLLYILSPILNSFIENSTQKDVLAVLVPFFLMEFCLGWFTDTENFAGGYTTLCFIGLYLLARYIRRYSKVIVNLSALSDFGLYLLLTIIPTILAFIGLEYLGNTIGAIRYCTPFVIGASIFFLLAFNRFGVNSCIINRLGGGTFSIYLIHQHPVIIPYFRDYLGKLYNWVPGFCYILSVVFGGIVFSILCVVLDRSRQWTWTKISNSGMFKTIDES